MTLPATTPLKNGTTLKLLLLALWLIYGAAASAQIVNNHKYKALFLGNSYTYVNNLPAVATSVAASAGDTLITDVNAIGGYTLQNHSVDATSLGKIAAGDWDYVVLQEQSEMPSFPIEQVDTEVFPYAKKLDSIIHAENSCGRTMFYMTWGREFGDTANCASWPPVCTYDGMDSLLHLRYMMMADSNNAVVSPVGAAWHYIRANFPSIAMYQADQSHPLAAGTYAAACCFYTAIFKRDPTLITYNFSLSDSDAAHIRQAVKAVVYDSMSHWHIGQYDATAQFTYTVTGNQLSVTNTSANASGYTWSFGDGQTSTLSSPVHVYAGNGIDTVTLVAINCGKSDTMQVILNLIPAGIAQTFGETSFAVAPNPAQESVSITSSFFLSHSCEIEVSDAVGQKAFYLQSTNKALQFVNLSGLRSGLYIISVIGDGQVVYRSMFMKN